MSTEDFADPYFVGKAFVRQYYSTLATNPAALHQFYEDSESQFQHFYGPEDSGSATIKGQKAIHDKIMSLGFEGVKVDLDVNGSVDCMFSMNGGVLVTVTGWIAINPKADKKPFVQTFFLSCKGPKKYFVLNDCFRYLPVYKSLDITEAAKHKSEEKVVTKSTAVSAPVIPATAPIAASAPVTTPVPPAPAAPVSVPSPIEPPATKERRERGERKPKVDAASPVTAPKETKATPKDKREEKKEIKEDKPKEEPKKSEGPKSWAAMAAVSSAPAPVTNNKAPKPRAPPAAATTVTESAPATAPKAVGGRADRESKPKAVVERTGYPVYVGGFEPSATADDLKSLFSQFGLVSNVTIVHAKNKAYVDFSTNESSVIALKAGADKAVVLNGRVLVVEPKPARREGDRERGDRPSSGAPKTNTGSRNRPRGGRSGGGGGRDRPAEGKETA